MKSASQLWLSRICMGLATSFLVGSASSLFLWGLEKIQVFRTEHIALLYCLPILGAVFQYLSQLPNSSNKLGTNDLIDRVNQKREDISWTLGPFILLGTWLSQVFGASVGREGTAVQMGGSIAHQFSQWLQLEEFEKRDWLQAGMAAGFASVFGTPWAGCLFGLEISKVGQLSLRGIFPCLISAFGANWVSLHVWGTNHTIYPNIFLPEINGLFWLKLACIGLFLGLIGLIYSRLESIISKSFARLPIHYILKGILGGLILLLIFQFPYFQESIGLGSSYLLRPFETGDTSNFALSKTLATSLSLGLGFKGGEATPLFLIGAHASSALHEIISLPIPLLAALGFTCLYTGLAKTPLTSMAMGIELFGYEAWFCFFICALIVMYISGKNGIFKTQAWANWVPKPLYS
ncbi:chloride channel protein [Aquirufa aurantiipilula]|uniref:Chloride channel protein n=1 Tax=Aquirufa aurantiipilula TaxID=2696561 RepID=A0ABT6BIH6_9BACT|nr:chloride channel protein [Aquirufa aurantiipilula]MDF5690260.1 chloride channel protein [Aquirufa aurantiipilula]